MIRRPPRSTLSSSSAASDVYKRQAEQARAQDDRLRDAIEQGPDGHRDAASGLLGLGGLMAWPGALAVPGAVAAEEGVDQDVRHGAAEEAGDRRGEAAGVRGLLREVEGEG